MIKRIIGFEDGRECYEATIRRSFKTKDIAELTKFEGEKTGKMRYKIRFIGFDEDETLLLVHTIHMLNDFMNTCLRNDNKVLYTNSVVMLGQ